jgi:hypothetical protein
MWMGLVMARQGSVRPQPAMRGSAPGRPAVQDLWPRVLLNPVFGLAIPTISGLVDPWTQPWPRLVSSYVWFVAVAFILWEGNRHLYLRLVGRCDWFATPWRRVLVIGGPTLLYTIPMATLLLWAWAVTVSPGVISTVRLVAAVALSTACVLIVVHVYETVFLLRDWESDRLRGERLERERVEAELEALRNQVEPHFLFNALNSLAYLVEHDREKALRFLDALGEVLRYIVSARGRLWVALDEELTFIQHYMTLMGLRFGEHLGLDVRVDGRARRSWLVLAGSLQGLVENAVKHNDVTKVPSFVVTVVMHDDRLEVRNPLVPWARAPRSTGTGLANLAERSRLALGRPVTWGADAGEFVVSVPLRRVEACAAGAATSPASARTGAAAGAWSPVRMRRPCE